MEPQQVSHSQVWPQGEDQCLQVLPKSGNESLGSQQHREGKWHSCPQATHGDVELTAQTRAELGHELGLLLSPNSRSDPGGERKNLE